MATHNNDYRHVSLPVAPSSQSMTEPPQDQAQDASVSAHNPRQFQTKIVDPEGDLILIVDDPDQDVLIYIRVSSKILTLASDVFAAMLGPVWSVTQDSGVTISQAPREVIVKDDNAAGMLWICEVLHYRNNSNDFGTALLESIAVISDKYNFSRALAPTLKMGLKLHRITLYAMSDVQLAQVVFVAEIISDTDLFWESSMLAVYGRPSRSARSVSLVRTEIYRKNYCESLPSTYVTSRSLNLSTTDALMSRREARIAELNESLEQLVTPLIADVTRDPHTLAHLAKGLKDIGLWPLSTACQKMSIIAIMNRLHRYRESQGECQATNCQCVRKGVQAKIDALRTRFENEMRGLCLKCHREGKIYHYTGNCTACDPLYCGRAETEARNFPIHNFVPWTSRLWG